MYIYSLHNGLALLHKYTSTIASDGVHQLLYQLFAVLFPGVWGTPIGEMPMGLKVFLDFALCHTCPVVGRRTNKVNQNQLDTITCDTICVVDR